MIETTTTSTATTGQSDRTGDSGLLESQAARIAILQEEIRQREDEVESLKATILDQWPTGTYEAGRLKVSIRPGAKTINASRFLKEFPPHAYPDLYKLSPDTTKARKQLGEERLQPVMTSRKPTVVIS